MSIAACQGYLGDLSRCQGDLEMAAVSYQSELLKWVKEKL